MSYKVLLPTSGTGSRLGDITRRINKALVPLNNKPAVEYVLASYAEDIPIVVTLGYLGEDVKTYLETNHPRRSFEFVWVDKYEGPGSSLGYSLLQAKGNLQCPFIFHACDGIFLEKIPPPEVNWIGGFVDDWETTNLPLNEYRTHTMKNGQIFKLNDRGVLGDSIHVGLDGIADYLSWWEILEDLYHKNPADAQISDVSVLDVMIRRGIAFTWVPYKIWLDVGNVPALKRTEEFLRNHR